MGNARFWLFHIGLHFLADWNLLSHDWVLYVPCHWHVYESVCSALSAVFPVWCTWVHVCVSSVLTLATTSAWALIWAYISVVLYYEYPDLTYSCTCHSWQWFHFHSQLFSFLTVLRLENSCGFSLTLPVLSLRREADRDNLNILQSKEGTERNIDWG